MHFFYLDEAGCNGRDLENPEQPIFVLSSFIVSDEKWNTTNSQFNEIISDYFEGEVPDDFELHSEELFSPNGDGPFLDHNRSRRNNLADNLLDLIIERSHHTAYFGVDKQALIESIPVDLSIKEYLDFEVPYLISFDYILSLIEWYISNRLGRTARAMIILDEKEEFESQIRSVVRHQKYLVPSVRRLTRIVEFSYPISSHTNPMVQLADLVAYLTKKFLEIEHGYREYYPSDVKNIYRDYYVKIEDRLIRKSICQYDERVSAENYYDFLRDINSKHLRGWKTRDF